MKPWTSSRNGVYVSSITTKAVSRPTRRVFSEVEARTSRGSKTPQVISCRCLQRSNHDVGERRYGPVAHDNLQNEMRRTRLRNESDEYLARREALRLAEIESTKVRER